MEPILKFEISNQTIIRTDDFRVVEKSKNYLNSEFTFITDEWSGLTKTAIFACKNGAYSVILENDSCRVPWECLSEEGTIAVSVFAGDLITVGKAYVKVYPSGYLEDAITPKLPPTDVFAQILSLLSKKGDALSYKGSTLSLLSEGKVISKVTISGGSGGREVELRNNGTYIQWKYTDDDEWTNLVALGDLRGPEGEPGKDGKDGQSLFFRDAYEGRDLTVCFSEEIDSFENAWQWIKDRVEKADYSGILPGDYIPFTTSNGYTFKAEIIGIDTYTGSSVPEIGHHIDFMTRELSWETHCWNKVEFNNGIATEKVPFVLSDLYAWINSEKAVVPNATTFNPEMVEVDYTGEGIYYFLPQELKDVISGKVIAAPTRLNSASIASVDNGTDWKTFSKLWLPYEVEMYGMGVFGATSGSPLRGMTQYSRFKNNMKRTKYQIKNRARASYWLASSAAGTSKNVCFVNLGGASEQLSAANTSVFVPICFRI